MQQRLTPKMKKAEFVMLLHSFCDASKKRYYDLYMKHLHIYKTIKRDYQIENALYASRKDKSRQHKTRKQHRALFAKAGYDMINKHVHHPFGIKKPLVMKTKKGMKINAEIIDAKTHKCIHNPTAAACRATKSKEPRTRVDRK